MSEEHVVVLETVMLCLYWYIHRSDTTSSINFVGMGTPSPDIHS